MEGFVYGLLQFHEALVNGINSRTHISIVHFFPHFCNRCFFFFCADGIKLKRCNRFFFSDGIKVKRCNRFFSQMVLRSSAVTGFFFQTVLRSSAITVFSNGI